MKKSDQNTINIIGAGLSGCFMALLLAKRGYTVTVYERYSKKEMISQSSSRSFNLTIYGYCVQILQQEGLWEKVKVHALALQGTMTQIKKHNPFIFSPVDQKTMPYYSVQRAGLLKILLSEMDKSQHIHMYYESEFISLDREKKTMVVKDMKSRKLQTIPVSVIFGAGGVHSKIRPFMQQGQETRHTQTYADWTYKQVTFTKEDVKRLHLKKQMAYTWTRKYASILAFPNTNGTLTAMVILPKNEERGYASLHDSQVITKFITREFPDLLPILSTFTKAFIKNPEGQFVTVKTSPWYYKDFIVILGDAAHGFLPFCGQGTSAAFGDCMELIHLMDQYKTDWEKIFPLYQKNRKKHMDALSELARECLKRYTRNKRADYTAIYEKFESLAYRFFPEYILPSIFFQVGQNPNKTADYVKQHEKQRMQFTYLGIPFAIALITYLADIVEKSLLFAKKKKLPLSSYISL